MIETFAKPIEGTLNFGLKPGDRLQVLKGMGIVTNHEPDWIEVIEELPMFILCKYCYKHWMGGVQSYRHCLNKVHIISGDISFQVVEQ